MPRKNADSIVKAICPLYNFQISEALSGLHTREESVEYFKILEERLEEGFGVLDNVKIRQITKEDIERVKRLPFFQTYVAYLHKVNYRTLVIEVLQREQDSREAQLRIYKVLLAMRLYRSDNVFCKVIWYEENSMVSMMSILNPPLPEIMGEPYAIEINEIEGIRKLARKIDKIDLRKRNSLRIACERFSRSYEDRREDDKIIDFLIGFEALFLKGKKAPSRKGLYIGLGCSMLLGRNDKERQSINEFLVKAYNLRNNIVHGSKPITSIQIDNEAYEIEDIIIKLREYLRESIKRLM